MVNAQVEKDPFESTKAVQASAEEELARRSLLDFAARCVPGYDASPKHLQYIAGLLEDLMDGKIRRLALATCVRVGKSLIGASILPAFWLGNRPKDSIVVASANEQLATLHSKRTLQIMRSEEWPWPNVTIADDSKSVQRFSTNKNGTLFAVGCSSQLLGRGYSLGICDDVLSPGSANESDRVWSWFTEEFLTRQDPSARILLIGARLQGDLFQRLEDSDSANEWTFASIPALATRDNDCLGRMEGESIWPKRFPVSELEKIKVEVGSAVWASQYMQMPLAPDAQIFSEEMLSHTYSALPKERIDMPLSAKEELMLDFYGVKPRVREIITIQALDSALKYGAQHDRSALVTLVSDGVSIFVADAVMGRFPFADLKLMVREQYKKWKPSRIFCEDVGSGTVLLEEMKREAGLLPLVPITPLDSKVSRAESVLGLFESGKIKFPERGAHWKADAINELLRFSEHCRHDDFTDALVHGIRQLRIFFEKEVKAHRQRQRVLEIEADWMHV